MILGGILFAFRTEPTYLVFESVGTVETDVRLKFDLSLFSFRLLLDLPSIWYHTPGIRVTGHDQFSNAWR